MLSLSGSSSGMTLTGYVSVWAAGSYLGVNRVTMNTVLLPVLPPAAVCALACATAHWGSGRAGCIVACRSLRTATQGR